jgi:hypothetical protein
MEEKTTYVHLARKIAAIKPTDWDYSFDPDEIFKIDPYNIFGEIITIPVLINRLGVLAAEMKSYVKEEEFRLNEKEAKVRQLFRQGFDKKPTVQETEDHLTLDPIIKGMRLKLIKLKKELETIENMHESAKEKSFKLNYLGKNLTPEEFEKDIIEGTINGVTIKLTDKRSRLNN